jgi:hypothetical protein
VVPYIQFNQKLILAILWQENKLIEKAVYG